MSEPKHSGKYTPQSNNQVAEMLSALFCAHYTTVAEAQQIANQLSTPVSVLSMLESVRIEWPEYRSWDDDALWRRIQDAFRAMNPTTTKRKTNEHQNHNRPR